MQVYALNNSFELKTANLTAAPSTCAYIDGASKCMLDQIGEHNLTIQYAGIFLQFKTVVA